MTRTTRIVIASAVAMLALGTAASFGAHGPAGAFRSLARLTVTPPSSSDPMQPGWLCRAQRDAMGSPAFRQMWAGNPKSVRGMGTCVNYMAGAKKQGTAAKVENRVLSAVQTCKADLRNHPASFRKRFGKTTKGSNALGRCVRSRSGVSSGRYHR